MAQICSSIPELSTVSRKIIKKRFIKNTKLGISTPWKIIQALKKSYKSEDPKSYKAERLFTVLLYCYLYVLIPKFDAKSAGLTWHDLHKGVNFRDLQEKFVKVDKRTKEYRSKHKSKDKTKEANKENKENKVNKDKNMMDEDKEENKEVDKDNKDKKNKEKKKFEFPQTDLPEFPIMHQVLAQAICRSAFVAAREHEYFVNEDSLIFPSPDACRKALSRFLKPLRGLSSSGTQCLKFLGKKLRKITLKRSMGAKEFLLKVYGISRVFTDYEVRADLLKSAVEGDGESVELVTKLGSIIFTFLTANLTLLEYEKTRVEELYPGVEAQGVNYAMD